MVDVIAPKPDDSNHRAAYSGKADFNIAHPSSLHGRNRAVPNLPAVEVVEKAPFFLSLDGKNDRQYCNCSGRNQFNLEVFVVRYRLFRIDGMSGHQEA